MLQKFRSPLPEDRFSIRERNERTKMLNEFSKKLRKERKPAGIDDQIAIRQLLIYVRIRLDLLDHENRHARMLAQFDSLLGQTAKPVSEGPFGVVADVVLDFGLKDRVKTIGRCEELTESLIAEITLIAPEINRLLDQREADCSDNFVLRPCSCLPETGTVNQLAPPEFESAIELLDPELSNSDEPQTGIGAEVQKAGDQNAQKDDLGDATASEVGLDKDSSLGPNGKATKSNLKSRPSDDDLRRELLDSKKRKIIVDGKTYTRNYIADKLMNLKDLTVKQLVAAMLRYGYGMGDAAIAALLQCSRKGAYDHRLRAKIKIDDDQNIKYLLTNVRRKN